MSKRSLRTKEQFESSKELFKKYFFVNKQYADYVYKCILRGYVPLSLKQIEKLDWCDEEILTSMEV